MWSLAQKPVPRVMLFSMSRFTRRISRITKRRGRRPIEGLTEVTWQMRWEFGYRDLRWLALSVRGVCCGWMGLWLIRMEYVGSLSMDRLLWGQSVWLMGLRDF